MKCNNCGANINYNAAHCPVCHSAIDCSACPQLYPDYTPIPVAKQSILKSGKFAILTLVCAAIVAAIALACNIVSLPSIQWSLLLAGGLATAWLMIFHSFNTRYGLGNRMLFLLLMLIGDVYLVGQFIGDMTFATCSLLPMVFLMISGSMLGCCLAIDTRKYLFVTIFFGLLSFIPMTIVLSLELKCMPFAIFTACVGGIAVFFSLVINGKNLKHLFRTFFHF